MQWGIKSYSFFKKKLPRRNMANASPFPPYAPSSLYCDFLSIKPILSSMKKMIVYAIGLAMALYSCGLVPIEPDTTTGPATVVADPANDEPTLREGMEAVTDGVGVLPSSEGKEDESTARMGFYNVENLFDTKDKAHKADEDFLPSGKYRWDKGRYQKKLENLSKVINYMGMPGLMGLSEVENAQVVRDLAAMPSIKSARYDVVHRESPDHRGIDVALMYSKDEYELVGKKFIQIDFPKHIVTNYTTRDVLHATFKNATDEYLHVFINHWPSRRGGVKESEPKRVYVASQVRMAVDDIFRKYDRNHIILMGDFNDEPTNKSVSTTLGAQRPVAQPNAEELYNLMYDLDSNGRGSHNYRGEWGMLDQIIVSGSLLDGKGTEVGEAEVFNRKWMLFKHPQNGYSPDRTYSGQRYYGGYSDHLPVMVELK
jgi:predicted extracellular nuclease